LDGAWFHRCSSSSRGFVRLVNRTNLLHSFLNMFYCLSLHVSGNYMPIIRRKFRTYATTGICHSIQGVTGGTDQTSGGCSLCQTIPKNPKIPISKVQWLRRYRPEKSVDFFGVCYCTLSVTSYSSHSYVISRCSLQWPWLRTIC